jgi:hypothetical protein
MHHGAKVKRLSCDSLDFILLVRLQFFSAGALLLRTFILPFFSTPISPVVSALAVAAITAFRTWTVAPVFTGITVTASGLHSFRFRQQHFSRQFKLPGFWISSRQLHFHFVTFVQHTFQCFQPFPAYF